MSILLDSEMLFWSKKCLRLKEYFLFSAEEFALLPSVPKEHIHTMNNTLGIITSTDNQMTAFLPLAWEIQLKYNSKQ